MCREQMTDSSRPRTTVVYSIILTIAEIWLKVSVDVIPRGYEARKPNHILVCES